MKKCNTFAYERVHGKAPTGIRTWYFSPGDGAGKIYSEYGYAVNMTYTDAKAWALQQFKTYPVIYVLP